MIYHLERDGISLGTLPDDEMVEALYSGQLKLTDLAWTDGMEDWAPLSHLVEIEELPPAAAAPPASRIGAVPLPTIATQTKVAPAPVANLPTSSLATASLVCGLVSLVGGCFTGVIAIVLGILALQRIERSGNTLGGRGIAMGGLVTGAVFMIVGTALMAALLVPALRKMQDSSRQLKGMNNARQIALAIQVYAADHNGAYPDTDKSDPPQSSNDAFRLLMKSTIVQDESIFTAPDSPYQGDGILGEAPHYPAALTSGENHWAMTKGLDGHASGRAPLLFENPMPKASWPPTWSMSNAGMPVPGRAWRSGKIIIARNDTSINAEELAEDEGDFVPLMPGPSGADAFTSFAKKGDYLDVQR